MLHRIICFFIIIPLLLSASDQEMKARMKTDLEVIRSTFQTQYAPMEWKANYVGWYLDHEIDRAKEKVEHLDPVNVKAYQRILKDFFNRIQDYHVNISFFSMEAATLPFTIKSANGHYFLSAIDVSQLPRTMKRLQKGDELIAFNGQPIAEAVKAVLETEFVENATPTDERLAEHFFTKRLGSQGFLVPKGPVSLTVKHKNSKAVKTYTMDWTYMPEMIQNIAKRENPQKIVAQAAKSPLHPSDTLSACQKLMLSPFQSVLNQAATFKAGEGLGERDSFLPPLGKKIWKGDKDSFFDAYLFVTPGGKKVGYIRIPHFLGGFVEFNEFNKWITQFEKESDALVIDELNNPGGDLFFMYALLSLLTDHPLTVPKHCVSLTQREVFSALETYPLLDLVEREEEARGVLGISLSGLATNLDFVKKLSAYFKDIIQVWNSGETFTPPLALYGADEILPHPGVATHYTKPILVLINEMDFSCGDLFPAILQDNKRAVLFGAKTAGAGGFVLAAKYPNIFGVEHFTYTGSIAHRPDDRVIENLGVQPDISYKLTEEDLTHLYTPYIQAVLDALENL
jgi:hypothetical protein